VLSDEKIAKLAAVFLVLGQPDSVVELMSVYSERLRKTYDVDVARDVPDFQTQEGRSEDRSNKDYIAEFEK